MQSLSQAQPWPSNLVKNHVNHNNANYKCKTEVGFGSQWASRLNTKNNALFAKEKRNALGHDSHFFAGDNEGYLNFRHFYLDKRYKNKVGVVMAADKAKDYYSILNVSKTASNQDIRGAYIELARQYHSDMNKSPKAKEKLKEIGAAYEVLSDEGKRSFYDQYGESGLDGAYEDATTGLPGVTPIGQFESFFAGDDAEYERFNDIGGTGFKIQNSGHQRDDDASAAEHKLVEQPTYLHGWRRFFSVFSKDGDQSAKGEQDRKMSTGSEVAAEQENNHLRGLRKFTNKFCEIIGLPAHLHGSKGGDQSTNGKQDKNSTESEVAAGQESKDSSLWDDLSDLGRKK